MINKDFFQALEELETTKKINPDQLIEALESALTSAYKKTYGEAKSAQVKLNPEKNTIKIFSYKTVVEEVENPDKEISLEDATKIKPSYKIGDIVTQEENTKDFGRIAAQTAKQVIMQRIREAERSIIYDEFIAYENDILNGVVERQDSRYIYVNLGKIEAVLSKQEQIPGEEFQPHDRIKVYVTKVENTSKGPQIFVSRSHPDLLKRLFEQEVPEIYDGVV